MYPIKKIYIPSPYMSDYSTFTRSTGSAIVLRSSLAYIGGEVVFDSNFAFTGGALNILDGSRVGGGVMLTVCVCVCVESC